MTDLSFVWLEITGRCQLECRHCYADSGPGGGHGSMTAADWRRVIDQSVELGVEMVQFIGGEPTLHPDLPDLLGYALAAGVEVEVFSNLAHVTPALWELFAQPGVHLACSYYSDRAGQHAAITGRAGSYARTRANIGEAVRRSIPLRVGVIRCLPWILRPSGRGGNGLLRSRAGKVDSPPRRTGVHYSRARTCDMWTGVLTWRCLSGDTQAGRVYRRAGGK